MGQPFGMYTAPKRSGATVAARALSAGTIDSRNGSASVAPSPRSTVRRGSDFLVTNIGSLFSVRRGLLRPHLKRSAHGDAEHDGIETIAVRRRVTEYPTNDRHVVV